MPREFLAHNREQSVLVYPVILLYQVFLLTIPAGAN
jgi:hypothetical protein